MSAAGLERAKRCLIVLSGWAITALAVSPVAAQTTAVNYRTSFSDGPAGWVTYRQVGPGDFDIALSNATWVSSGGYIESRGPWWVDPQHAAPGAGQLHLVSFVRMNLVDTALRADLSQAVVTFRIRTRALQLNGGRLYFFFITEYQPETPTETWRQGVYVLSGVPLDSVARSGEWTNVRLVLSPSERSWTCLGVSRERRTRRTLYGQYGCVPIAQALRDVTEEVGLMILPTTRERPATGTIQLDDFSLTRSAGTVSFMTDDAVIDAARGTASIPVRLDRALERTVAVRVVSEDSTASASYGDYQPVDTNLVFPPGTLERRIQIRVEDVVAGRGFDTGFKLRLHSPTDVVLGEPAELAVTIVNSRTAPSRSIYDVSFARSNGWYGEVGVGLFTPAWTVPWRVGRIAGPWAVDSTLAAGGGLVTSVLAAVDSNEFYLGGAGARVDVDRSEMQFTVRVTDFESGGGFVYPFIDYVFRAQAGNRTVRFVLTDAPMDLAAASGNWVTLTADVTADANRWTCLTAPGEAAIVPCPGVDAALRDVNRRFGLAVFPANQASPPRGVLELSRMRILRRLTPAASTERR